MEAGTTYIEAGFLLTSMLEASASMEVDGSRWKLFMEEVDEAFNGSG